MKKKEDGGLYVKIDEPVALRRELLLCRKEVLQVLHKSERLRMIRNMKSELTEDVRKRFRDIYYLNNKLRSMVPIEHLRSIKKEMPKAVKAKQQDVKHQKAQMQHIPAIDKELGHIERIEAELRDIEKRLDSL